MQGELVEVVWYARGLIRHVANICGSFYHFYYLLLSLGWSSQLFGLQFYFILFLCYSSSMVSRHASIHLKKIVLPPCHIYFHSLLFNSFYVRIIL